MAIVRRKAHMQGKAVYDILSPSPEASLLTKLSWWYHSAHCDIVGMNVAMSVLLGVAEQTEANTMLRSGAIRPEDISIVITHMANVLTARDPSAPRLVLDSLYCIIGLGITTPLAMLARHVALRTIAVPLGIAQRAFFYGGCFINLLGLHSRLYYPTIIRDKHAVAQFLSKAFSGLDRAVDKVMAIGDSLSLSQ
ncbi:hypothetical protein C8Q77DRAFT_2541 [Trametes polyzona]|nr:hypothetical protein C8Q77DRAFT_2541 [Trametes polyzona]